MRVMVIEKDHEPLRDESWNDGRVVTFPDTREGHIAARNWLNLLPDEDGPTIEDGHYYDAVLYERIESVQHSD